MFKSRQRSGLLVAKAVRESLANLPHYSAEDTLVLALNKEAVPIALEVAFIVAFPLNVLLCKEVSAPCQPGLAVGAVAADGSFVLDTELAGRLSLSPEYIETQKNVLTTEAKRDEISWRHLAGLADPLQEAPNRIIVVGSGTEDVKVILVGLESLRCRSDCELIFAAPVISKATYAAVEQKYNHVIVPEVLPDIGAVEKYYRDFGPVSSEEVVWALKWATSYKTLKARQLVESEA